MRKFRVTWLLSSASVRGGEPHNDATSQLRTERLRNRRLRETGEQHNGYSTITGCKSSSFLPNLGSRALRILPSLALLLARRKGNVKQELTPQRSWVP